MAKVTLTRQVTDGGSILPPGEYDLPDQLAAYYRQQGWTDQPPVEERAPAKIEAPEPEPVAIPKAWKRLPVLERLKLARQISGQNPADLEVADETIAAEVERRVRS